MYQKLSRGFGNSDDVRNIAKDQKPLLNHHFQLVNLPRFTQYTLVCQKKLLWDSDQKSHVQECAVIVNPQDIMCPVGQAIWNASALNCYLCKFRAENLETVILHYAMEHIKYQMHFMIKNHKRYLELSDNDMVEFQQHQQSYDEFILYLQEETSQAVQLEKVKLVNQIQQNGLNDVKVYDMILSFIKVVKDQPLMSRIDYTVNKFSELTSRNKTSEIEKLQNMQMKYIHDKNLSMIWHDPLTGHIKLKQCVNEDIDHNIDDTAEIYKQLYLNLTIMEKKIEEWMINDPLLEVEIKQFMKLWNKLAINHQFKSYFDTARIIELLMPFCRHYKTSQLSSSENSRNMLLIFLTHLYQNNLIKPTDVQQHLQIFDETQ
eukprot:403367685